MIELVAFDLDGTVLDAFGRPSPASLRAIEKLLDRGLAVASISGRSIRRSQEPFAGWPEVAAALHVGAYNGGVVVGPRRQGQPLLRAERLDEEVFLHLAGFARDGGFNLICCLFARGEEGIEEEYRHSQPVDGLAVLGGPGFALDAELAERCLAGEIAAPPKIMLVTGAERRAAVLEELRRALDGRVYLAWSLPDRIEAMPPQVDKGLALRVLCAELGIGAEEVLAVGDGDNDLPMLRAAGRAVLMGNADEEVRRAARHSGIELGRPLAQEGFARAVAQYVEGI